WKMLIPYLARRYRVVTFDGPGNGSSSKPFEPEPYTAESHVGYALAVLDATRAGPVSVIAVSGGTHRSLRLAADHRDRVVSMILFGPHTPFGGPPSEELSALLFA